MIYFFAVVMTVFFSGSVFAQTLPDAFTKECPQRTTACRWCAAKAIQDGWKVTYRDQSRPDMMDTSWLYEVWTREHEAVLCICSGGRGGIIENYCRRLKEAS